jgi:hypothetical protein
MKLDTDANQSRVQIDFSKRIITIPELAEQSNFHAIVTKGESWFCFSYSLQMMCCFETDEIEGWTNHKIDSQKTILIIFWGNWISRH